MSNIRSIAWNGERIDMPDLEEGSAVSRRAMLKGAAGASAAGIAATALGGMAVTASGGVRTSSPAAPDLRGPAGTEAADETAVEAADETADETADEVIVVHVRDVAAGEIDIYRGTTETRLLDRELAARLARASR
jgi:enterochelin esterase-like enzyme